MALILSLCVTVLARAEITEQFSQTLYRPCFISADSSFSSGLAFVAATSAQNFYLLTAHSLFGPYSGLDRQWTPTEIARSFRGAIGISLTNPSRWLEASPYIFLPQAGPFSSEGASCDLAAFSVAPAKGLVALSFNRTPPKTSDRIFVMLKLMGDASPYLMKAQVIEVANSYLVYRFDNSSLRLDMTRGAPVLDTDGRLLGMHMGTTVSPLGDLQGVAVSSSTIWSALTAYEQAHAPLPDPVPVAEKKSQTVPLR